MTLFNDLDPPPLIAIGEEGRALRGSEGRSEVVIVDPYYTNMT